MQLHMFMHVHACMLNIHDEDPRVAALFAFIMSQKDGDPEQEDDEEADDASDEEAEASEGAKDDGEQQSEEEKDGEPDPCVEDFEKEGDDPKPPATKDGHEEKGPDGRASKAEGGPRFCRVRSKSSSFGHDYGNDRQYENAEEKKYWEPADGDGCVIVSETLGTNERAAKRAKLMALMQQISAAQGNRFHV